MRQSKALRSGHGKAAGLHLTHFAEVHGRGRPIREPFASMPINDLRELVHVFTGEISDRRKRAAVLARYLAACVERCPAEDSQTELAIQAIERGFAHFRPASDDLKGRRLDQAAVEHLDWGRREVDRGLPVRYVACVLTEQLPAIPVERWEVALAAWHGEIPTGRGRPKKGREPYRWHQVAFRLVSGQIGDVEPEATHWRDNLLSWREEHGPKSR